jgi:hypothetical protein
MKIVFVRTHRWSGQQRFAVSPLAELDKKPFMSGYLSDGD